MEQMDKHLLSHLPPQPPGLLVHTTSRMFMVPETARNEMGRVALFRAGTAVDGGGRINQEAGLGLGCPGLAWSLSKERAHQTAAPGRDR